RMSVHHMVHIDHLTLHLRQDRVGPAEREQRHLQEQQRQPKQIVHAEGPPRDKGNRRFMPRTATAQGSTPPPAPASPEATAAGAARSPRRSTRRSPSPAGVPATVPRSSVTPPARTPRPRRPGPRRHGAPPVARRTGRKTR